MIFINLKNNLENISLFRSRVIGARLSRGKNIPNKNILNFNIITEPLINILANIQGSGDNIYVINIFEEEDKNFNIIHDCPDFKKGNNYCKHIVKLFLVLDNETCKNICSNFIHFTSDFNSIKKSKANSYIIKSENLIKESKYLEAINYLKSAYEESKNFEYIEKILEIAKKFDLPDQFIKYVKKKDETVQKHKEVFPKFINLIFKKINEYTYQNFIDILISIREILIKLPENDAINILKEIKLDLLKDPLFKFMLLYQISPRIEINKYYPELLKEFQIKEKNVEKINIKTILEGYFSNLLNEAILNMESEEVIDSFLKIADIFRFTSYTSILRKINDYKKKLEKIYLEGLKLKHAFIRSLVITNTNTDKLRQIKFNYRYKYPSLIWAGVRKKQEKPLFFFILEKCGFDKHHLQYTHIDNFIENFPVFSEIFDGNNPIPNKIRTFWETDKPKITNIIHESFLTELDFEVNYDNLDNYILIEWDLAQKPILGSYICQFFEGYLIPDQNHPLTYEIKPFDLILCEHNPITIKGNNVKVYQPIKRVNVKTAIELVYAGIRFIVNYLPFNVIQDLKDMKLDEIDAYNQVSNQLANIFSPKKEQFKNAFNNFVHNKISMDLNKIYLKTIKKSNYKEKVLKMVGFYRYSKIFNEKAALQPFGFSNLKRNSLQELKMDLKKLISKKLTDVIKFKKFDQINIETLKKFSEFKKWTVGLIYELKQQLDECKIYQITKEEYEIHELFETYYGKAIIGGDIILNLKKKDVDGKKRYSISKKELFKIIENFKFLKIQPPEIIS